MIRETILTYGGGMLCLTVADDQWQATVTIRNGRLVAVGYGETPADAVINLARVRK